MMKKLTSVKIFNAVTKTNAKQQHHFSVKTTKNQNQT